MAPAPAQIVPKSQLSDEVIIEVLAAQFQQHTPVYRQCACLLEDHGIGLSRQTLDGAVLAAAGLLVPVVQAQAVELLSGDHLQADETTLPCQVPDKTGKNHLAYLGEHGRPGGAVVFDLRMGRGRKTGPGEFLKPFRGRLRCDGCAAYDKLGEGITFVACMAHIRRRFVHTAKVTPLDPLPVEIVRQIGLLYDVEAEARSRNLTPDQRLDLRQIKSRPLMTALKKRILQIRQDISPDRALAGACDYALGQWERTEEYLRDGQVEIDNNWCEGGMRPIPLGRKNWLHLGDETAGGCDQKWRSAEARKRVRERGNAAVKPVADLHPTAW